MRFAVRRVFSCLQNVLFKQRLIISLKHQTNLKGFKVAALSSQMVTVNPQGRL